MTRRWWFPRIDREKMDTYTRRFVFGVVWSENRQDDNPYPDETRPAPTTARLHRTREAHVFVGRWGVILHFRWERKQ